MFISDKHIYSVTVIFVVVTPGQNEKYYLAGALHSGTGKVSYVGGNSKSSALFISLLKRLKATYPITLIVDNYIIHKSRETRKRHILTVLTIRCVIHSVLVKLSRTLFSQPFVHNAREIPPR